MLYESRKAAIRLFNDYSLVISEAKYKTKYGKCIKILTPKQMLQRLPIGLAQVKAGNTSENYFIKSDKPYILCIEQNESLGNYITILWIQ